MSGFFGLFGNFSGDFLGSAYGFLSSFYFLARATSVSSADCPTVPPSTELLIIIFFFTRSFFFVEDLNFPYNFVLYEASNFV